MAWGGWTARNSLRNEVTDDTPWSVVTRGPRYRAGILKTVDWSLVSSGGNILLKLFASLSCTTARNNLPLKRATALTSLIAYDSLRLLIFPMHR